MSLSLNPNDWLNFFLKWPRNKVAGTAVLVVFLIPIMVGGALAWNTLESGTTGKPTTINEVEPAVSEYAASPLPSLGPTAPKPEATTAALSNARVCSVVSPTSGSEVGGTVSITGQCKDLAGATVFVIVRDLYPNLTDEASVQHHWIQCAPTIKQEGDFICGAFLCIDQAEYEVLVVWPHTPEAFDAYDDWLLHSSNEGKIQLPALAGMSLIGGNHVVRANHRVNPTPAACSKLRTGVDK